MAAERELFDRIRGLRNLRQVSRPDIVEAPDARVVLVIAGVHPIRLQESAVDTVAELKLIVVLAAEWKIDHPAITAIDQKRENARRATANFDHCKVAAVVRAGLHTVPNPRLELGSGARKFWQG